MYQKWRSLLFLHWILPAEEVAATLPEGLHLDTWEGKAYVGLVPFYMRKIRPRFAPSVPGISNFLEMNVRTYVHDERGNPGVWFYSLDANQPLAVAIARRFFHLPYTHAEMHAESDGERISYRCRRKEQGAEGTSQFRYAAGEELPRPEPGSLEFFLLERYLLFAHDSRRNRLWSGRVHHTPYPVFEARVDSHSTIAVEQAGFTIDGREPDHAAYSPGVEVEVFAIESITP